MTYNRHHDIPFCYKALGCKCDRKKFKYTTLCLVGGACVLLLIVLLALSIKDINHDEFGVSYNKVSRSFSHKILGEGRHTLQPANKLFLFSNRVNTKEETIECISKNGLVISFTISTQFRINREEAFDILYEWHDQDGLFTYLDFPIRDAARDSCARFLGKDFFQQREEVEQDLAGNVSNVLRFTNNHVTPSFVQLKNIGLPLEFLQAIQAVQAELENVQVEESKRPGILIKAQTDLIAAQEDAKITIVKAEAQSQGIRELASQKALARTTLWNERLASIQFGIQSLSPITPEDYVDKVLFPQLVSQSTTPSTQACLETCSGNNCWFCWVGQVSVSPVSV